MKKRILTAALLVLFSIPLFLNSIGGYFSIVFASAICFIGIYEMLKVGGKDKKWSIMVYIVVYFCSALILYWNLIVYYLENPGTFGQIPSYYEIKVNIFTVIAYLLVLLSTEVVSHNFSIVDCFYVFSISLIITVGCQGIIFIRHLFGRNGLLFVLLVTCGCDCFAHLIGSKCGKHLLAPIISPHKTWEGAIGGCACATIIGVILFYIFPFFDILTGWSYFFAGFGLSLCLSIGAVFGDLVFSSIKRQSNIKDFSNLLPGHGGVLDRTDSLLFNILVFLVYYNLFYHLII